MHEISLIQSLLEIVNNSAAENGITRITRVKLVVGEQYGALPDALEFAFQLLTEGTACAGAVLDVEKKPPVYRCCSCRREFKPESLSRRCPCCLDNNALLVSGRELYVDYYEGE